MYRWKISAGKYNANFAKNEFDWQITNFYLTFRGACDANMREKGTIGEISLYINFMIRIERL